MERSFDSLNDAVEAASNAHNLEDALQAIVGVLREEFQLFSARISVLPSRDSVRVVASWSAGETLFTPGTEVSTHLSADQEELAEQIFSGRPAIITTDTTDMGLAGHVLRREGVASMAIVPLHEDGDVVAIITFGSSSADALGPHHLPFFTGIGRGTEASLVPHLREAERSSMRGDVVS